MSDINTDLDNDLQTPKIPKLPIIYRPNWFITLYFIGLVIWLFVTCFFQNHSFFVFNIEYNIKEILSLLIKIYLSFLGIVMLGNIVLEIYNKHSVHAKKVLPKIKELTEQVNMKFNYQHELENKYVVEKGVTIKELTSATNDSTKALNKSLKFQIDLYFPMYRILRISSVWRQIMLLIVFHVIIFTIMFSYSPIGLEKYKDLYVCLQNGFISYSIPLVFLITALFLKILKDSNEIKAELDEKEKEEKKS